MPSSNSCFLTYIQISQEAGQVVWYSHLLKNFPAFLGIHTVKDFGIVNKAEVDFFWNSFAFLMIQRMLPIWSLVPIMKKTFFGGVLVLKGLVVLIELFNFSLLSINWSGHRLGLPWYWMVCLRNKQRSFCRFWNCIQVLNFGLFFDYDGYAISSKGFLPQVIDIMVIWVKFTHSSPF